MMNIPTSTPSSVWDIQASEPYESQGEIKYREYSNLRLHVLADTAERAIELFRECHPAARLHQVIKRSNTTQVIVDPDIFGGPS